MKVYLEFEDGYNTPCMMTYDSEDQALARIAGHPDEIDYVRAELFSENGPGEWSNGSDKYTLITFNVARGRAEHWNNVAKAILAGKNAPP